jgi:hypothetical protein
MLMKRTKRNLTDPAQTELFAVVWWKSPLRPFRLRAGDVVRFNEKLCRVIRVNECSAVLIVNQKIRDFKTRFDKPVRFQPPPSTFRISPNSDLPILNP